MNRVERKKVLPWLLPNSYQIYMNITQSKRNNDGSVIYAYRFRDLSGKLKSVSRKEWAHIDSKNRTAMLGYLPILEAKFDHRKLQKEQRESWHDKYYNYTSLVEEFIKYRQKQVKDWKTKTSWFQNYGRM
jgi:hypothetical protein